MKICWWQVVFDLEHLIEWSLKWVGGTPNPWFQSKDHQSRNIIQISSTNWLNETSKSSFITNTYSTGSKLLSSVHIEICSEELHWDETHDSLLPKDEVSKLCHWLDNLSKLAEMFQVFLHILPMENSFITLLHCFKWDLAIHSTMPDNTVSKAYIVPEKNPDSVFLD